MAVNQNHAEGRRGAVIPRGESLLKQCSDVELSFPQQPQGSNLFSGTKTGTLFLTSYRVIFVTSRSVNDPMSSFMMPFDLMSNCAVEQPVFGANYIKGTIQAAPDGGWEGQATFKLVFKKGGAVDFIQLMVQAASAAAQGVPLGVPNSWMSPTGIFVITGEGNVCTPQTPCQVIVYGVPHAGYGALPPGYGAPPPGYRAPPPGYGALPPGYGAPPAGFGAPPEGHEALPPGHGAPPPGYGALPPGYGAPPSGYGAPPAGQEAPPPGHRALPPGYGAPPPGYGALPPGYGAPPPGYRAPPPGYGATPAGQGAPPPGHGAAPPGYGVPPAAYEAPPAGSGVGHPNSVAAQTPGHEASLPSTSSSQAHSPPSKM